MKSNTNFSFPIYLLINIVFYSKQSETLSILTQIPLQVPITWFIDCFGFYAVLANSSHVPVTAGMIRQISLYMFIIWHTLLFGKFFIKLKKYLYQPPLPPTYSCPHPWVDQNYLSSAFHMDKPKMNKIHHNVHFHKHCWNYLFIQIF